MAEIEVRRPRPVTSVRPFSLLEEMEHHLNEPFSDWPFRMVWWRRPQEDTSWAPPIDMYEKADSFIIRADLPGVKMEDIDISLTGEMLTIRGERKVPEGVSDEEFQCCEMCYGPFARSIALPMAVQADKIEASYENGVLEVRLPKLTEEKKTRVTIKAKSAAK